MVRKVRRKVREELKLETEAFVSPGAGTVAGMRGWNARRSEISKKSPNINSMDRRTWGLSLLSLPLSSSLSCPSFPPPSLLLANNGQGRQRPNHVLLGLPSPSFPVIRNVIVRVF